MRTSADANVSAVERDTWKPNAVALEHFNAAMQLWRDISLWEALFRFADAANADPSFARAHLYYSLIHPWITESVRLHYRRALEHREALDEADKKILDAMGPSMQDPPDLQESERRLTELLESTHSFFIASAVANRRLRLDRPQEALATLSQVEEPEKSPAFDAYTRATVALAEFRKEDAMKHLDECLKQSPTSSSCLRNIVMLQSFDGACAEAEASTRRWIAAWPNNADAYKWLAAALYGHTHSVASARAALERRWALSMEDERDLVHASDITYLAMLEGDIDAARRGLDEWEHVASSSSDARTRGEPADARIDLEYEVSPVERVRALTNRYIEQSAAWSTSPTLDFGLSATRMLLLTGTITEEEAIRRRDTWLNQEANDLYAVNGRRWFNFYATLAVTPRLARDAVEHIPPERPSINPLLCETQCAEVTGETFLLAGDPLSALPHLQRADRACFLEAPMPARRARYLLGQALESVGRNSEACEVYGRLVNQWPSVPSSRMSREATARLTQIECNSRKPSNGPPKQ